MCKECGKPILSNSFRGQKVELFLLRDGKVLQQMSGEYDSYGRVFTKDLKDSILWDNPTPEIPYDDHEDSWNRVCDLMFDKRGNNGIAAIHSKCYDGIQPSSISEDDPNQGWGNESEYLADTAVDTEFD
jgi:hypothetical protein